MVDWSWYVPRYGPYLGRKIGVPGHFERILEAWRNVCCSGRLSESYRHTRRRGGRRSSVFCFPNSLSFAMLPAVAAASPALSHLPRHQHLGRRFHLRCHRLLPATPAKASCGARRRLLAGAFAAGDGPSGQVSFRRLSSHALEVFAQTRAS